MIQRFDRFLSNISEIDLYWHRLASAEMERYGVKGTCALYFTKLSTHPDGLTAAQLAALCSRDKADVSRDMTALEKNGVVTRVQTDGKAYRARIVLTEKGRAMAEEISRKVEYAVTCVGQGLTDSDREVLYRSLEEITANLRQLSEQGLPQMNAEE